jgi:glucosylceramidase
MRVPIGASDFSTSVYSYDETDGDFELDYFSVEHDSAYILPMIQSAQAAAAKRTEWTESLGDRRQFGAEMNQVRVLATPWSAPSWMKRNKHVRDSLTPGLEQDSDTQEAYAAYVSKFVVEYAAHGVDIWAISVQNEPHVAGQVAFTYPCMGFSGSDEGKFLGQYLGPRLKADHPDLKIFIHDDQKQKQKGDTFMVDRVNDILDTGWNASQFVDGAAYHWYGANLENYVALEQVHSEHPDLVLLATEATLKWPSLAKWQQGVKYAIDIIGDLNAWSSGWVEWNVLLDGRGGPTCIGPGLDSNWTSSTDCEWEILHSATFGHCDAPIRVIRDGDGDGKVDGEGSRLYFGVQYYMMGHFSRFLPPRHDSSEFNCLYNIELSSLEQ